MAGNVGARAFQNARLQKKFKKQAEALLSAAFTAYQEGRRAETEALCQRILQDLPDHFEALHLMGVCALDSLKFETAKDMLGRAAAANPRSADVCCDLGTAFFELKSFQDALVCQEKAIALKPNFPMALTNLGNTLLHMGRADQAIEAHDRAIELKPDYADAYCNRGMAELMLGRFERASQSFDRALAFHPRHVEAITGKGIVCLELRHYDDAAAAFAKALAIVPNAPKVLAQRGRLNMDLSQLRQADADFDAALAVFPTLELALRGRAQVSVLLGNVGKSMAACKALLEQNPRSEVAPALLASCFASQGDFVTAIEHLDAALAIKPDYADAITRKIFALDFLPGADFAVQQAARKYWWDAVGAQIGQRSLPPRPFDPEKRIVVGYVSSDFKRHSAGFAFLPVLRHHDQSNFHVICYSCSPAEDEVTAEFRKFAGTWVNAWQLSDDELADRVQADGVDILVDLSGHTSGNRLNVFARKPAPIQVTAWGSGTGTGLKTMDYIFADPVTVPEAARPLFAERVYDLPAVITMDPIVDLPVAPLPMLRNGYVTFGVFNRIYKISDDALRVWSAIIRQIGGSKILLKHVLLDDQLLRDGLVARFMEHGIPQESIVCLGSTSRTDHLRAFENVDLSLDPFPQNGGISTWESLYMGVPAVAKLGDGASARAAGAILTAIGLGDWVADNDDEYVATACRFASDPVAMERLRTGLRSQIAGSWAGDVKIYTRKVEAGYRQFWRDHCATAA